MNVTCSGVRDLGRIRILQAALFSVTTLGLYAPGPGMDLLFYLLLSELGKTIPLRFFTLSSRGEGEQQSLGPGPNEMDHLPLGDNDVQRSFFTILLAMVKVDVSQCALKQLYTFSSTENDYEKILVIQGRRWLVWFSSYQAGRSRLLRSSAAS